MSENEAFVELLCPDCEKYWEASPTDLPAPDATFECPDCGARHPTSEFMRNARGLEVLREFH